MELWMRFSVNARKMVLLAHDRAKADEKLISGAYLTLGLIGLGEGKAFKRLQSLPDFPALTGKLDGLAAEAPPADPEGIRFTPPAQRAITRAYELSKAEASEQIETRHLLAGLLRESEAAQTLREAGLIED